MTPERTHVPVVIIGGGPGGYSCGIRAGQLGVEAVVIDDQPLGGTCLNIGCIPSKALIHVADEFHRLDRDHDRMARIGIGVAAGSQLDLATTVSWKDNIVSKLNQGVGGLLKRAGTNIVIGRATVIDGKTVDVALTGGGTHIYSCDHLVLATGSVPIELTGMPFGGPVLSSTEALSLTAVPERLTVIGGGYIGLELGMAYAKLGAAVTVVEAQDRILATYDRRLVAPIERSLSDKGVTILTSTVADDLQPTDREDVWQLALRQASGAERGTDSASSIETNVVLVAVGRRPALDSLGADNLGLSMNGHSVAVNQQCHTSMRNVWAIGDLTGEPMLAHRAIKQGEVVAEAIAGHPSVFDPAAIAAVVFTDPELVTVGIGGEEAKAKGVEIMTGTFRLAANGRTMTLDQDAGFVTVVARADNHEILGIQAVGAQIAELSGEFSLALEMGARLEDIGDTIHAHPTIGEALAEAAVNALR